jgi:hypothetical protein
MPTQEIVENVCELNRNGFRTERENPVDDMICPHLVGRVQVAGFGCRLEWPHDDSRWIGAQMKPLPVQERSLRHGILGSLNEKMTFRRSRRARLRALSGSG